MRNILLYTLPFILFACGQGGGALDPTSNASQVNETDIVDVVSHVDWSKNAVIYEVNLRQHTEEGTFE
ncbi:MAG: hypothetical protein ACPGWM_06810, partial [Flavobacteriales bacterium]